MTGSFVLARPRLAVIPTIHNMKMLFFRHNSLVSHTARSASQIIFAFGLAIFMAFLVGCGQIPVSFFSELAETVPPAPTATHTLAPTLTATPSPPTATPVPPTLTATPSSDLSLIPAHINIYPVPQLYAGDLATFQITAYVPEQIPLNSVDVDVYLDDVFLVRHELDSRNLGGQARAIIEWAWDTSNAVGNHTISIVLDPDNKITEGDSDESNNQHHFEVTVLSDRSRPLLDAQAAWISHETDQAYIHVIAGTAAERDLSILLPMVDQAITQASTQLQEEPRRKFDVYFIDRVIGQGGYAGNAMVVSYLDRNYSGGEIYEVLVHETIHLLDRQFVGNGRLNFLAEGVAVWGTGGHYKAENLQGRAKALLANDLYIPLSLLIDDFYPIQHEIGYLQAGAFVEFLVDQYGWETVRDFYTAVDIGDVSSRSAEVDSKLQQYIGLTLEQVEQKWIASLHAYPYDPDVEQDLLASVRFYNVMRQYQLIYDPTAHFLHAWLPRPSQLREQGLTAELNRHPTAELNLVLETMLTESDVALRVGDYQQTHVLLNSVERMLNNNGLAADPLSHGYIEIVAKASEWGFEVHRIEIGGSAATVWATNPYSPNLQKLAFSRNQNGWFMLQ